jgi:hypothetical protein
MSLIVASAGGGAAIGPESATNRRQGCRSLVMVTHSMEEAAMADLVGVFSEGRLVAFDSPQRVFGELYDPAWGIARPYVAELAQRLGLSRADGSLPLDIEGLAAELAGGCHARP